jgi:hypothetical protein
VIDKALEQRTRQIFYLLACEDPRHPKADFLLLLIHHIKAGLMANLHPRALSENTVGDIMTSAVHQFIQESAWEEIIRSWHSADIYEALKIHVERILNPPTVT